MSDFIEHASYGEIPSKREIRRRLDLDNTDPEKLVITPMIDPKRIEDGTVDLRLGTEFVVAKRSKYSDLDALDETSTLDSRILEYQEKIYVKVGSSLVLHPHQFTLGATFEYVKMPVDMLAYVLGRSSWGRLGLVIATATVVHPSYAGIITLELTNVGETPIKLYPGIRIAQFAFHKIGMTKEEKITRYKETITEKTKYKASVSPMFSKVHQDEEWAMIRDIKNTTRHKERDLLEIVTIKRKEGKITEKQFEEIQKVLTKT